MAGRKKLRAKVAKKWLEKQAGSGHMSWREQGEKTIYDPFSMCQDALVDSDIWEYQPAHVYEFITGKEFLGYNPDLPKTHPDYIKPCIVDDLIALWGDDPLRPACREAVLSEAIGTGKSFRLGILIAYATHVLLCLKHPGALLGTGHESKVAIVNVSINEENSRRVVFGEVQTQVNRCMWFNRYYMPNPKITSMLVFDAPPINVQKREPRVYKNINVLPGHSKATSVVGFSVWLAAMDEASLYQHSRNHDYGADLYNALTRRITSRYADTGLLVCAGSPMYTDDFLARKVSEAREEEQRRKANDDSWRINPNQRPIFCVERSHWEAHHPNYNGEYFYVSKHTFTIHTKGTPPANELRDWLAVPLNTADNYLNEFEKDPIGALRDLGGVTVDALQPFFELPEKIEEAFDLKRKDVWNERTRQYEVGFHPLLDVPHALHVDLSKMKGLDACGIALGHIHGKNDLGEPCVYIDMVRRIQGKPDAPIPIEYVRNIIYELRDMRKFNIQRVTLDGFQNVEMSYELEKHGFIVEYLSVDRTMGPYEVLKTLIYNKRIMMYYHPVLANELHRLELVDNKKIDHPRNVGKDMADALAGVCQSLIQHNDGIVRVTADIF